MDAKGSDKKAVSIRVHFVHSRLGLLLFALCWRHPAAFQTYRFCLAQWLEDWNNRKWTRMDAKGVTKKRFLFVSICVHSRLGFSPIGPTVALHTYDL